jgi:hypothetical protein
LRARRSRRSCRSSERIRPRIGAGRDSIGALRRRRRRAAADVDAGLVGVFLLVLQLVDDFLVVAALLGGDPLAAVHAQLELLLRGLDLGRRIDPLPAAALPLDGVVVGAEPRIDGSIAPFSVARSTQSRYTTRWQCIASHTWRPRQRSRSGKRPARIDE